MRDPHGAPIPDDDASLLLRQVNPTEGLENGELGHLAFRLKDADQGLLSFTYEPCRSAEGDFHRFTGQQHSSCGVVGITVTEARFAAVEPHFDPLPAPSGHDDPPADECHVCLDQRHLLGGNKAKKNARSEVRLTLLACAEERGWIYVPPSTM